MSVRVLIIEDEKLIRWSLRQKFEARNYQVTEVEDGNSALQALHAGVYDLIMLDYKLPDTTGLEILRTVRETDSDVVVIMMTAYSSIESAVDAIKLGAYDYITKPFDMDDVLRTADKALETTTLRREVRELRRHIHHEYGVNRIIGQDPCMLELFEVIDRVARSSASTVFLRGDSGTGKDLLARVIHYNSDRAPKPFMNITCTALSETLLESELFGHEKGAFTDAKATKKGLFELADGGTIFLDEVGDMPLGLQAKLLRFLEERLFRRVGGTQELSVDVRVVAATNRDIEQAIEDGQFRNDLMYRLNVIPIYLPPLRDRGNDLKLLTQHFVDQFSQEFRKPVARIDDGAYEKLYAYSWPGNVRELRNVLERAVLLCKGEVIGAEDIVPGRVDQAVAGSDASGIVLPPGGINMRELENRLIQQALARTNNNQTKAARLLHLSRDAFRYRLEKLGLL
ncbi:MAG: sigma-54-dependent Fis family transcriptional regulator [Phycisphaerales bacterium]|nr:MAG: sigma-54-dependent Fis family transcriptional regulator [Phycisphaerales bacterium]